MKLLKFTNTINPASPIHGHVILSDAELATLVSNREIIRAKITADKKFIVMVGDGFIPFMDKNQLMNNVSIVGITDSEASRLVALGIDETGFAKQFKDGVLNWVEDQFIGIHENPSEM